MLVESVSILAVCLLMLVVFMRSRFSKAIFSILPIAIIPLAHILVTGVVYLAKGQVWGFRGLVVVAFIDAIALGITCAVIVYIAQKIANKLSRRLYKIVMVGYSVIIGWVYIFTTLQPLLNQ